MPFAAPAAAQAADTSFEAESMTAKTLDPVDKQMWPQSFADATAAGGAAFKYGPNSTASKTVTTDRIAGLTVRARGDQCTGAPNMKVSVDGRSVASFVVSATAWTTYTQAIDVPAGSHAVDVSFDNNYYESGKCNRNLLVDSVTLTAGTVTPPNPTDTTPPVAPSGLSAVAGDGRVTLDWADNADADLAGYEVHRSTTAGTGYMKVTSSPLVSSGFSDLGRTNGTGYHYVVKAVDASGNVSASSAEASAVPASVVTPPPPSGSIVWTADAERAMNEEWAGQSSAGKSWSLTQVTDAAQGSRAYRHDLRKGDTAQDGRARAELGMCLGDEIPGGLAKCPSDRMFKDGQERWIAFQVRFEKWNTTTSDSNNFMQIKPKSGAPPLLMKLRGGKIILSGVSHPSSGSKQEELWSTPWSSNLFGKWLKFELHVKFGRSSSTGFMELYGDVDGDGDNEVTQLMSRKNRHTMRSSDDSSARIGQYTGEGAAREDSLMFSDGYTVATTREAAEANAFRR